MSKLPRVFTLSNIVHLDSDNARNTKIKSSLPNHESKVSPIYKLGWIKKI